MEQLPYELRDLPHNPDAEASTFLHGAIAEAAQRLPEDTIRSAISMIRDDMENFDLQQFYETQGENVEIVDDDFGDIIATRPM